MASLPHATTNPKTETPSNSETAESSYPKDSVPAAGTNSTDSTTSSQSKDTSTSQPMSAEAAADKLYEERIEEEYAKREGGA